ncbi:anti-sigma factor family protein [Rhodanobacter umsongensis]|uniref:Anti-sigma factor family protein n=1 Tax=Rhodanobacter umsongensis TaxID=633153 RepID=A0ABW0JK37_9GAMM
MTTPVSSDRDCLRAWEAMPWVLQDSATPAQAEWLQAHLAQCAACRAEFAQQSRLRRAMTLPPEVSVDANVGLARLLARLDMPEPQAEPAPLRSGARSGSWLNRALVAVVLLQALGIGALGVKLWSADNSPSYRTLSEAPAPAVAGTIRVVPDAAMSVADWNALLHALQLKVVGGPNDVGAYTVVPAGPGSASASRALRQLRATRGIRLAEPVAGTP